jgi:FAD/FMN-containing dehydrogenase
MQMRGIRVDVENKVARVDAGCLLGDVDAELSAFGLIVPAGTLR